SAAQKQARPFGWGRLGCAANIAMRRCGTWQGNDHCLRPAPCLAIFGAATRLAPKRQQTLGACHGLRASRRGDLSGGVGGLSPGRQSHAFRADHTLDFVLLLIIGEATQQALLGDDFSIVNAMVVFVSLVVLDIALSLLKTSRAGSPS